MEVNQNSSHGIATDQNENDEPTAPRVNTSRANDDSRPGVGQTQSGSTPTIPKALSVEEGDRDSDNVTNDVHAERLIPWWKQNRTKVLFSLICILGVVTIIVALAVTFSGGGDGTITEVIEITSIPITNSPTVQPSMIPSSSQEVPSHSPTSCAHEMTSMAQTLDLPLGDPTNPRISMDGRNAVVVARESNSDSIYLTFYSLSDDDEWIRSAVFMINYLDSNLDDMYDFAIALSGTTAFLGLPLNRDGAGLVYIFEQNTVGVWESVEEPLVPEDGRQGAHFGYRVDINDGLAVVSAFDDRAIYVFQNDDDRWVQLSKLDIDYSPHGCFLVGQSILVIDVESANIYFYEYDKDLDRVMTLQDPLVSNPRLDEYQGLLYQILETGTGRMISAIKASEDYFVYSTSIWKNDAFVSEGVFVYERHDTNQNFTLLQYFNSTDYEEGFGWNLAPGKDILIIGVGNTTHPSSGQTHVFSKQDGYFEESLTFTLDEQYDTPKISGRNVLAIATNNNTLISLNLEDCTPPMPTQIPSSSLSPTVKPSTISPTSQSPTSTSMPSAVPSFSSFPSTSMGPSHAPTSSAAPTICYSVKVTIMTTGANTEGFEGDVTSWQLYNKQSGEVALQGGQLKENQIDEYEAECLQEDDYVFNITNSGGNGFGDCDTCGYFIYVDGVPIGGSVSFFDNERFTFSLPVDGNAMSLCSGDFFIIVNTDGNPEEITWVLANDVGDIVLAGGPYRKSFATYREFACLPDGEFTFTIYDSGGDGSSYSAVGSYFIGMNHDQILNLYADLNFGPSSSTTFVLGP